MLRCPGFLESQPRREEKAKFHGDENHPSRFLGSPPLSMALMLKETAGLIKVELLLHKYQAGLSSV
jgi:hypothetical protein